MNKRTHGIFVGMVAIALAIATIAVVFRAMNEYDTPPVSFARTADPNQIVLTVTVGLGDQIVGQTVREDAKSVAVTVRVRRASGDKPALGVPIPYAVMLSSPLDHRTVLSGGGQVVPER